MAHPILQCFTLLIFATLFLGIWGLDCNPILAPVVEGKLQPSGELKAEGYTFPHDLYERINATHFKVCMCSVKKCLRKCCPPGKSYLSGGIRGCQPTTAPFKLNISDYNNNHLDPGSLKEFYLTNGNSCYSGSYKLSPDSNNLDVYYVRQDGFLFMPNVQTGAKIFNFEEYCVEDRNTLDGVFLEEMLIMCFLEADNKPDTLYPIGMIISIPFLLVTFLVYAILPELRNLHGKSLMCHVASLTIGYVFLVMVQLLGTDVERNFCKVAGYLTQFGFIASFFWLNVMSFDIWWTFSGYGGLQRRGRDRIKFLLYSAYAWGGVGILMIVSVALDLSPNLPAYIITPRIGELKCWFASQAAALAFFYGPMAVILLCNCVLFAATAYKIFIVKQEANRVLQNTDSNRTNEANRQRFFLYLKLFLVMGVNWVMEVISWLAGGPKEIWYVTDVCNTLQGLFIFFIFVWKNRTKKLLKSRFRGTLASKDSDATVTTTAASFKSSRNSSSLNMNNLDRSRKISTLTNPAYVTEKEADAVINK